jgi:hypothetical protein
MALMVEKEEQLKAGSAIWLQKTGFENFHSSEKRFGDGERNFYKR